MKVIMININTYYSAGNKHWISLFYLLIMIMVITVPTVQIKWVKMVKGKLDLAVAQTNYVLSCIMPINDNTNILLLLLIIMKMTKTIMINVNDQYSIENNNHF